MIFAFTFDNSLSGWKFMSVGMHKGMHYLSPPCADVSSLSCTLERSGKKLYRIIDVFPLSGSEKLYYGNKKKNISIYVKTITQTFHFDWRFNENSFLWSFFLPSSHETISFALLLHEMKFSTLLEVWSGLWQKLNFSIPQSNMLSMCFDAIRLAFASGPGWTMTTSNDGSAS